jgi:putative ABC transport system permease protein
MANLQNTCIPLFKTAINTEGNFMLPITPVLHSLMQRKFGVFLFALQIAFATAIFSNLGFVSQTLTAFCKRPSGINENQLFSVTMRSIGAKIHYADVQHDLNSLQGIANVEQVAYMRWIPLWWQGGEETLRTQVEKNSLAQPIVESNVSPHALAALGLNIIAGRDFLPEDMMIKTSASGTRAKKIIITQVLAEILFEHAESAIGKIVYEGDMDFEIIGVTHNWLGFRPRIHEQNESTAFFPQIDEGDDVEQRYIVRTKNIQLTAAVIENVSRYLMQNYHNELNLNINKISEVKTETFNTDNMISILLKVINIVLGAVVAIAISGQTLFWINQRIKQIGVRRALGASQRDIMVLLLLENTIICSAGLAVGILLSLLANQATLTLGYPPLPPLFLMSTCVLLLALCLISTAIPAWRASKISPSVATRTL